MRLTVLTAARRAEIRRATPDQLDLDAAVWTVSAESMKMSRQHRVPLSLQAVAVVRQAIECNGSQHVFHGRDGGKLETAAIAQARQVRVATREVPQQRRCAEIRRFREGPDARLFLSSECRVVCSGCRR